MHEVPMPEEAPLIRNTIVGNYIKAKEETENGEKEITYEVTDVYHYMVRAMSLNRKKTRCFSYGDLIIMRREQQSEELEALRRV